MSQLNWTAQEICEMQMKRQGQGGQYGGNWNALTQAQSSAAQAADYSYQRALALAAFAAQQQAIQALVPKPNPIIAAIEDAGIRAGEIIGWRAWRVVQGLLRSMFIDRPWVPREPMVGCPSEGSGGVHAFKERKRALVTYGNDRPIVIGKVALWGEVIEHEMGYRAEFGQVESLDELIGDDPTMLEMLRKRYLLPS